MEPVLFQFYGLSISIIGTAIALTPNLNPKHWKNEEDPKKHWKWKFAVSVIGYALLVIGFALSSWGLIISNYPII